MNNYTNFTCYIGTSLVDYIIENDCYLYAPTNFMSDVVNISVQEITFRSLEFERFPRTKFLI